jgi:hypothetical protein
MTPRPGVWPVDAHVHFHRQARVAPTLDAALANFSKLGRPTGGLLGVLLLAQGAREQVFEVLQSARSAGGWSMVPVAGEPQTLIARSGRASIALVCGRQVRADDGLELLALGTEACFEDGRSFGETYDAVQRSGALPVIPWGVGKWLGRRGQKVARVLETTSTRDVFLGDNGGRLGCADRPRALRAAEARGFRIVPGTDPFPFGEDYRRVGGFGFLTDAPLEEAAPWRRLHGWLRDRQGSPVGYGHACGPLRFVVNQVGIQAWNRLGAARRVS